MAPPPLGLLLSLLLGLLLGAVDCISLCDSTVYVGDRKETFHADSLDSMDTDVKYFCSQHDIDDTLCNIIREYHTKRCFGEESTQSTPLVADVLEESPREDRKYSSGSSDATARYSSFQCTGGGNQQFPENWHFYDDSFASLDKRVCLFKNVCLDKSLSHIKYYQHPEERKAPAFAQMYTDNLVLAGVFDSHFLFGVFNGPHLQTQNLFKIFQAAIPEHMSFIDNKTWIFSKATLGYNYAHLLLDDFFPALAALEMFNIELSNGHAMYIGCEEVETFLNSNDTSSYSYFRNMTAKMACEDNYRLYSKLIFGEEATPMMSLYGQELCFKQFLVGHSGSLHLGYVDRQRGISLRKGRDVIIKNLNLQDPPPVTLSVVVLTKENNWPTMCVDIETMIVSQMQMENLPIQCIAPGDFSVEEEIKWMQSATVIVAIHGTISELALFARDGTVLISIGQENERLKEGQSLPYATHIKTLYTTEERTESLPSLIRYALFSAATNFQIPFLY